MRTPHLAGTSDRDCELRPALSSLLSLEGPPVEHVAPCHSHQQDGSPSDLYIRVNIVDSIWQLEFELRADFLLELLRNLRFGRMGDALAFSFAS